MAERFRFSLQIELVGTADTPGTLTIIDAAGDLTVTRPKLPTDVSDYVNVRGFLVPRMAEVYFEATLLDPSDRDEWLAVGRLKGIVVVAEGVPRVTRLNELTTRPATPITNYLLDRIPIAEISVQVLAAVSLTQWQERHYELVPEGTEGLEWLQEVSRVKDSPMPTTKPPLPVLEDADGRPWYRVRVLSETALELDKAKRPRIDRTFLAQVRQAYRQAREDGRSTTLAVARWYEQRTGKSPGDSTVHRWIRLAKDHYGEEF